MCDYAYAFQALIDAQWDAYDEVHKWKEKLAFAELL